MNKRIAKIRRRTKETDIKVELNLDSRGKYKINTGIGFLNHMLELFAFHGGFNLKIEAKGDLDVGIHHTNEDIGIALGEAFNKALQDKKGITRFGSFYVPMEEALVRVVLDISGRPSLYMSKAVKTASRADYKFSDCKHFMEGFMRNAGINLHIDILKGEDLHHIIEAVFKSLAKSLRMAVGIDLKNKNVPSTKGKL